MDGALFTGREMESDSVVCGGDNLSAWFSV